MCCVCDYKLILFSCVFFYIMFSFVSFLFLALNPYYIKSSVLTLRSLWVWWTRARITPTQRSKLYQCSECFGWCSVVVAVAADAKSVQLMFFCCLCLLCCCWCGRRTIGIVGIVAPLVASRTVPDAVRWLPSCRPVDDQFALRTGTALEFLRVGDWVLVGIIYLTHTVCWTLPEATELSSCGSGPLLNPSWVICGPRKFLIWCLRPEGLRKPIDVFATG